MQSVILAAGMGTRLRPFTYKHSKGMSPVAGKPLVRRVIERHIEAGVDNFVVIINNQETEVQPALEGLNIPIQFVVQGEQLGMAHALKCAAPFVEDNFILAACDSLFKEEDIKKLIQTHDSGTAKATLTLQKIDFSKYAPQDKIPSAVVTFNEDNLITKIVEKPMAQDADSGLKSLPMYVFSRDIVQFLDLVPLSAKGEYNIQDAIQMLIDKYDPIQSICVEYRLEVTYPQDLLKANIELFSAGEQNVLIASGALIGENCKIGPNVLIQDGCTIGDNCVISNSVILEGNTVAPGITLDHELLL